MSGSRSTREWAGLGQSPWLGYTTGGVFAVSHVSVELNRNPVKAPGVMQILRPRCQRAFGVVVYPSDFQKSWWVIIPVITPLI